MIVIVPFHMIPKATSQSNGPSQWANNSEQIAVKILTKTPAPLIRHCGQVAQLKQVLNIVRIRQSLEYCVQHKIEHFAALRIPKSLDILFYIRCYDYYLSHSSCHIRRCFEPMI
jgi:pyridoxal biosynthesis lyase PdxS